MDLTETWHDAYIHLMYGHLIKSLIVCVCIMRYMRQLTLPLLVCNIVNFNFAYISVRNLKVSNLLFFTLSLPTSPIGDVIADCQRRGSAT